MKKNTGYKEMLRDRCPRVVSLALKWSKAKEEWLDHVYHNFIWILKDNKERLNATKTILGIDKKGKVHLKFEDTILWDNLSKDEKKKWKKIVFWVSWFKENHLLIQNNAYDVSKKLGKDILSIKYEIMNNYLGFMFPTKKDTQEEREKKNKEINELLDFLIDSFENRI